MSLRKPHLLNAPLDFLMVGGLSIITYFFFFIFKDHKWNFSLAYFAFLLSFFANFPHFIASYQLLYHDYKKNIFESGTWTFVALIIPLLLLVNIFVLYWTQSLLGFGILIRLMFTLVGWHYVKQILGCMIVLGARRNFYFQKWQRFYLKGNLISLWILSIAYSNQAVSTYFYHNVPYKSFLLPKWFMNCCHLGVGIFALLFFIETLRSVYFKKNKIPPTIVFVPFVAIQIWFLPLLDILDYGLFIPFFHSLQYLLFVFALKINQYQFFKEAPHDFQRVNPAYFFLSAAIIGGVVMEIVPRIFDLWITVKSTDFDLMIVGVSIFINIHHYFIDHIIWKKDVDDVQHYLFGG